MQYRIQSEVKLGSHPGAGHPSTTPASLPILRFLYTDHAKAESERKFQELEAEVPPPPASSPAPNND
jgi:hypothetical protein